MWSYQKLDLICWGFTAPYSSSPWNEHVYGEQLLTSQATHLVHLTANDPPGGQSGAQLAHIDPPIFI